MNILFIGNFEPSFSTERDRAWSLNQLGHNIFAIQENKATVKDFEGIINDKKQPIDLIIYSHTHGWEIKDLVSFFQRCKSLGIPTTSVHLDRWAWLARASDIGREATWFTKWQFMADASPEAVELYDAHKLNWHYLKPGVIARDCYLAKPDHTRFPHEIVFVGSRGYHPEYNFREKLVQRLHAFYGDRFGHYGSDGLGVMRGDDLNVLMASSKIVVGDSCFGGRPNYVSDRYYETRGRGGFLLHPHTDGHDIEGVGHYNARDLNDLCNQIDWYIDRDKEREMMRTRGFEHVKQFETYTERCQEILDVIFGKKDDA